MLFNSLDFLVFFILVFAIYWSVPAKNKQLRSAVILVASYFFYGYWDWRFLGLIALSTLVDFVSAQKISKTKSKKRRQWWLALSVTTNLGLLGFFKYFNFFAESFAGMLMHAGINVSYSTLNIILPIGISFYTFQTLSYTIDVYRQKISPTQNLLHFAAFVAFFPQLVAGPIERAADLLPQFSSQKKFDYSRAVYGGMLMIYGFFKKVAIADNLSAWVDPVFENPDAFYNWEVFGAFVAFGIQIYTDFSGYSDIAIGLAAVFGFNLSTNFKTPYFSDSIRTFWTRWHITLYSWFRDYVFIPLGGSRAGASRRSLNLFLTFALSGLWHGAGLNYVLFGIIHGSLYSVEKQYKAHFPAWLTRVLALLGIILAWGVFRATKSHTLFTLYENLFLFNNIAMPTLTRYSIMILVTLAVFAFLEARIYRYENFATWAGTLKRPRKIALLYAIIFWMLLFGAFNTNQNFIYFQF